MSEPTFPCNPILGNYKGITEAEFNTPFFKSRVSQQNWKVKQKCSSILKFIPCCPQACMLNGCYNKDSKNMEAEH
jgi:hypothetical protein